MKEKWEDFMHMVKDFLLFIVTPLGFLAGFVWFFLKKNQTDEVAHDMKAEDTHIQELKDETTKQDQVANQSSDDYLAARADYLRNYPHITGNHPGAAVPPTDKDS